MKGGEKGVEVEGARFCGARRCKDLVVVFRYGQRGFG